MRARPEPALKRLSWLLPVRDGARWLGDAVGSALADSGPEDELLVIDDGSRDQPERVLLVDPRLRLLRQPPRGIVAALEAGRAAARGRFLARIDCDDLVLPGRIDAQLAALAADPGLGAVGGQARLDPETPAGMRRYVDRINRLADPHPELLVESPIFHPAASFRREAVAAVGGWREGDFAEDYDLFLRLAAAGWRLANLRREVLHWRDRPDRLTRTDPRYSEAGFLRLKQRYLSEVLLPRPSRVVLWGAGRAGRPWTPWLLAAGHAVVAVLDLDRRIHSRHGVRVIDPAALPGLDCDRCFVAVGSPGAREAIRARMPGLRPDWVEGRDWFALA